MNSKHVWQVLGAGGMLVAAMAVAYEAAGPRENRAGHNHGAAHDDHKAGAREFSIPYPLTVEHQVLHEALAEAVNEPGEIGKAAKSVAELLHPHFVKEEKYALPLLGLLASVSKGQAVPQANEAIAMAGKLKADLPHMLEEHRRIVAALDALKKAAGKAGKAEYVHFAENLTLHAQTEEQVLYPAAILVGEYLKLTVSR